MEKVAKAMAKCSIEVIPPLPKYKYTSSKELVCLAESRHLYMGNALLPTTTLFTRTNVSLSFSDSKTAILWVAVLRLAFQGVLT